MNRMVCFLVACAFSLPGCERDQHRYDTPPTPASRTEPAQPGILQVGPVASAARGVASGKTFPSRRAATDNGRSGRENPHERNAVDVAEGKRLYRWYNCNGCHAAGGGGIGPALMDDRWIYGHEPAQIVATILHGRPNGMPSFDGRIPEEQAWKIAAYVRSMSGQLRSDVAPSRGDGLSSGPPEQRRERQSPKTVGKER